MNKRLYRIWMALLLVLLAAGIFIILYGIWHDGVPLRLPKDAKHAFSSQIHCIQSQIVG